VTKIEEYIDEIQPEIVYCYNCQPYEGGEPIWIMGRKCNLEELFNKYEVPENIRGEVADELGVCRS